MSILRSYIMDLIANTAADSVRKHELDTSGLTQNGIALAVHYLVMKNFIYGKLSDIVPDKQTEVIVESYLSQFISQYGTEMAMGHARNVSTIAKDQMFYSISQYLLNNASQLYPTSVPEIGPPKKLF